MAFSFQDLGPGAPKSLGRLKKPLPAESKKMTVARKRHTQYSRPKEIYAGVGLGGLRRPGGKR